MKLRILLFLALFTNFYSLHAQTFAFGVKGGLTIANQKWENYEKEPLFTYHGDFYIESADEEATRAMFGSLGYHVRGSSLKRVKVYNANGELQKLATKNFQFKNIVLGIGAKQKFPKNAINAYYMFGLRGEYNIGTNLSQYHSDTGFNSLYFPDDNFVKKFVLGLTIGGGIEFSFSELVGGILELSVQPDLLPQYERPPLENVPNPYPPGQTVQLSQQRIKNLNLELTFGIRFLRKVVYVD